jgi:hypothetical protein
MVALAVAVAKRTLVMAVITVTGVVGPVEVRPVEAVDPPEAETLGDGVILPLVPGHLDLMVLQVHQATVLVFLFQETVRTAQPE